MRELALGNPPPISETERFLKWVQDALVEIQNASQIDRAPNQIEDTLTLNAGALEDISLLADPNADRMFVWDDSEGKVDWLTAGTGLAIAATTLSFSFLGLEALVDPNADRIYFWDDTAGASDWLSLSGLTITGTSLAVDAATESAAGALEKATDGEIRAATSGALAICAEDLSSAAADVALTSTGNATAVDWASGINFSLTTDEDTAISNPTNEIAGTYRTITVQGDDGTSRIITFGSEFGGTVPTITDCTSTKWYLLTIRCVAASHFIVSAQNASPP